MMHLFRIIRDSLDNFLFPKSNKVLELESLSIDTLLKILPQAEKIGDGKIIALFDYGDPLVKEIVWQIKYSGNSKVIDKISTILYDTICQELSDLAQFESANWADSRVLIIPVPMSDKRRFERGWNQSELITEKIISHDEEKRFKYLPRQLAKIHHTESQTKTSSKAERLRNLSHSMKVLNPASVEGKYVVLVDDVVTTGSTFTEATRALKEAGAKKVLSVAIAH